MGDAERTDHDHDLLDELALVEQAAALVGILREDAVEGLLGVKVGSVVLFKLLARVIGAVGRLLGLLYREPIAGLAVKPSSKSSLKSQSLRSNII